jgi:hypothetical protein
MKAGIYAALAFISPSPSQAGWTLMSKDTAVTVANSTMTVTPDQNWSRWTSRPSVKGEIWTIDGLALNELSFFGRINHGETLYRERDSRNMPLPKFRAEMLPTDIVEFFETSNRIVLQTTIFTIDKVEPAKLDGYDAVRFEYHFTVESDQLNRKGEGVAANVNGKLYLVNFAAPEIHYFDRDITGFRALVARIRI